MNLSGLHGILPPMLSPHTQRLSPVRLLERLAGFSARVLFILWLAMILGFACAYFVLSAYDASQGVLVLGEGDWWVRFGNATYFSVITATTLGYGDLIPLGFSKVLAAGEATLGFFVLAVFISKLVSQKQETAIYHVHTLAFQNAFFTTREGFFILRRDCDLIAANAVEHGSLNEKSWANLTIVYQKAQTLLEGILDFYDDFDWYDIDVRRENLLLDSVLRTLERFVALTRTLDTVSIPWRKRAGVVTEVESAVKLGRSVIARWKKHCAKEHAHWFPKIEQALEQLAVAA